MDALYERNGLVFWTEKEIQLRETFVSLIVTAVKEALECENQAFRMMRVEAPILTPKDMINSNYTVEDYFSTGSDLVLRPETTMGSYQYAKWLLEHTEKKVRLPICVWQYGKSFRQEQDQVTKNMRLKEFYQLEFQCIYGVTTKNDYSISVIPAVKKILEFVTNSECHIEESDRLPSYSEGTTDIVCSSNNMEICSISRRKDFAGAKVLEVAVGMDRCVYNSLRN